MDPLPLLWIARERLKAGREERYGNVERQIAYVCATMGCPNPYLALASVDILPREVWWLNAFSSHADVERVKEAYALNTAMMKAMGKLITEKRRSAEEPVETLAELRTDLSDGSPWRVGELPFAVILEMRVAAPSAGAVYQAPDGRAFAFGAASDLASAGLLASAMGSGARIFEVREEWSFRG